MAEAAAGPKLVISRTPMRVSFAGGGTDLEAFYGREYGAVLSTTIDKYVYVTVKRHSPLFGENYRLNYAETEHVHDLDDVRNDIARECLRLVPVEPPVYISTVGDIPAASGLGGSSSFAVGLLKALHALRGERVSPAQLVAEASTVEIDMLGHPIGKQDQSAAAYGGLNFIRFLPEGTISLEPLSPVQFDLPGLFGRLLMFWTGITRNSSTILEEQRKNTESRMDYLRTMRDQAEDLNRLLRNGLDVDAFGRMLDEGWALKRRLASTISDGTIDGWYETAKAAGAVGGKICGAGGGGFLLLVAPPDRHARIREAMNGLEEIDIGYEPMGTRLLFPSQEG